MFQVNLLFSNLSVQSLLLFLVGPDLLANLISTHYHLCQTSVQRLDVALTRMIVNISFDLSLAKVLDY